MKSEISTLKRDEQVSLRLERLYEQYGYQKYRMNKFEEYAFYIENKNFLDNDRFITFNDVDGKLMALKPDVTLSIAKNTKAHKGGNEKLYYNENVFRMSLRAGEFKELRQTGVEFIGKINFYNTIEVISLALGSLSIIDNSYILAVSHMGFISGLLEECGFDYLTKTKVLSCLGQKNLHDLERLIAECSLSENDADRIKSMLQLGGKLSEVLPLVETLAKGEKSRKALDELKMLGAAFRASEYEDKIILDFSIISDTDYYNGILFSGFVEGVARAVVVGGRYDYLLKKLGKSELEALGFAVNFYELDRFLKPNEQDNSYTVVLYNEQSDPSLLFKTVEEIASLGGRILVETSLPADISIKKVVRVGPDRVVTEETVA